MSDEKSKIMLYTTDNGEAQASLKSRDGRVLFNQKQMADEGVSEPVASINNVTEIDAPFR